MGCQRGFGLVELMVSLVLGMIVVGGALVLLLSTRQANGNTENLSRVQDSVRTSFEMMTREVREAGASPCDSKGLVSNVLNNAQGLNPTWWATWNEPVPPWRNQPVLGFDGATAFPGAAIGAAVAERVNGTDAVIVRYAAAYDNLVITAHDTANTLFTTNVLAHGIPVGELVMVCNYSQAAIMSVSAVDLVAGTFRHAASAAFAGNCSAGLGLTYPTDCTALGATYSLVTPVLGPPLVGRFVAAGWYIGNNGRPETGGRSLYRVTRNGTEEVAEGVRDMQLSYLVGGSADYVTAGAVAADQWENVTAVRFDLTFESPDSGVNAATGQRLARTVSYTANLRNQQP